MDLCPATASGDLPAVYEDLGRNYWQPPLVILQKAFRSTNGRIGNNMRSNRRAYALRRRSGLVLSTGALRACLPQSLQVLSLEALELQSALEPTTSSPMDPVPSLTVTSPAPIAETGRLLEDRCQG
jgi:hypothetical protein